jgi:hypothetical protein
MVKHNKKLITTIKKEWWKYEGASLNLTLIYFGIEFECDTAQVSALIPEPDLNRIS